MQAAKSRLSYTPRIGRPITELPENSYACAEVSCGSVIKFYMHHYQYNATYEQYILISVTVSLLV